MKEMRHILVAVSGETPAIITETLWHLTQVEKLRISEIHVLTTTLGKRRVMEALLSEPAGKFYAFCREYGIDPRKVRFAEETIHILTDGGEAALADIRSDDDNLSAADCIARVVRDLASDPDAVLHCSVAGGRKTMTIYMAFALQLYGRPMDTLSHVLVNPELENRSDFFYIPKKREGVFFRCKNPATGQEEKFPAKKARIEVAQVPFVRLRHRLPNLFQSLDLPFSDMVSRAQEELDAPVLRIDLMRNTLGIGERILHLSEGSMNFYLYFVNRKKKYCSQPAGDCHGCSSCYVPLKQLRLIGFKEASEVAGFREREDNEGFVKEIISTFRTSTDVYLKRLREVFSELQDDFLAHHFSVEPVQKHKKNSPTGIRVQRDKILLVPASIPRSERFLK